MNLMDYGDGLRVNCRVRHGGQSTIIRTREAWTRVRPRGQGGAEGPGWRTSRQAWAAGPGLECREWAPRTRT